MYAARSQQASLSWEGLLVERVPTPDGCYEGGAAGEVFCDRGVAPVPGSMGTASFYYLRSCDDPSDYTTCSDQRQVDGTFTYEVGGALELTVVAP